MKKLGVALVILLGIALLAGCGNKDTDEETTTEINTVNEETSVEKFEGTIKDIYKKGGKMTCTMMIEQEGVEMKGKLYMDGKNMRTDFEGGVEGMVFTMNTITKDGYSYTRNSMSKEGWKMKFEEDEAEEVTDTDATTDMDTPMSFTCKKGVEGSNTFDLPSNIEFKEFAF